MKPWNLIKVASPFLLTILVACGGGVSTSPISSAAEEKGAASQVASYNTDGMTEFSISSSGQVELSNLKDDSKYLLAIYSSQNTTSQTAVWQAGDENSGPKALMKSQKSNGDVTEDIHAMLRANEEALDSTEVIRSSGLKKAVRALDVGSSRNFNVLSSLGGTGSYSSVTATLRYSNSNIYVYVDDRDAASLTDEEIEASVEKFSGHMGDEHELFGSESDVNGDGHIAVLFTHAVNALGASGGGFLTGYFYALDLYPAATYPASNEMEILYSMVPDPDGSYGVTVSKEFSLSNIIPSVLPHEFQHMISYNEHVLVRGGAPEAAFLNEGLSHLAEDIYSRDAQGYMAQTGIENPSRVATYLSSTSSICFTCGSSLAQRGGSYLFMRYLYEQAEKGNLTGAATGADLIADLEKTTNTGVANIVAAALADNSSAGFDSLMARFAMALYLSGSPTVSDSRYTFSGINLWEAQDDNRGTMLAGPAVTETTGSGFTSLLTASGVSYVKLSGKEIKSSALALHFSAGMQGGGYLLELQ